MGGRERCLDTHGGFGFAADYDIERKFRETRLYKMAPINNNLVQAFVGQHVSAFPGPTDQASVTRCGYSCTETRRTGP